MRPVAADSPNSGNRVCDMDPSLPHARPRCHTRVSVEQPAHRRAPTPVPYRGDPMTNPSTFKLLISMPVWPLLATLAVQTLATMSLYSLPTVAPEVARDLRVEATLVGGFV